MTAHDPSVTNPNEHGSRTDRVQYLVVDGVARPAAERIVSLEEDVLDLKVAIAALIERERQRAALDNGSA